MEMLNELSLFSRLVSACCYVYQGVEAIINLIIVYQPVILLTFVAIDFVSLPVPHPTSRTVSVSSKCKLTDVLRYKRVLNNSAVIPTVVAACWKIHFRIKPENLKTVRLQVLVKSVLFDVMGVCLWKPVTSSRPTYNHVRTIRIPKQQRSSAAHFTRTTRTRRCDPWRPAILKWRRLFLLNIVADIATRMTGEEISVSNKYLDQNESLDDFGSRTRPQFILTVIWIFM